MQLLADALFARLELRAEIGPLLPAEFDDPAAERPLLALEACERGTEVVRR